MAASKSGNKKKAQLYVKAYPWFISEAHKRQAKIHGLGFNHFAFAVMSTYLKAT